VRLWQGVGLCRQMELIPIGGHDGSCRCDTHWCRPCRPCSSGAHLCGGGGLVRHAFLLTSIPRRPTHIHEGNTDQGTAHLRHALTFYRASGSRGSAGRNDPLQLVIITNNPACLCKPDEDGEQNWLIWEAPPTDGHHNQPHLISDLFFGWPISWLRSVGRCRAIDLWRCPLSSGRRPSAVTGHGKMSDEE
jgi:hypothetical protein